MGKIFDIDGPFMSGLSRLADIIILDVLFLICSLPVVTAGASATAMYYITLKMVKNEECYIVKGFFKSFKQNFFQATVIWIITLFLGSVLYVDLKIVSGQYGDIINIPDSVAGIMTVMLIAASVFYIFTAVFVFPQLAKFDNTVKNTIKNAFLMAVSHFPSALCVTAITVVPVLIVFLVPAFAIFIFIIFSLSAYCNSYLFVRIYKKYIPDNDIVSDNEFSVNIGNPSETVEAGHVTEETYSNMEKACSVIEEANPVKEETGSADES